MESNWKQVHTHGQWTIEVDESGAYRIVNYGPNCERRFYLAESGQYGEPLLVPEPDLAFAVPARVRCVDVTGNAVVPDQKISGIIAKEADGRVVQRVSLTNARAKGLRFSMDESGTLELEDGQVFHLYALVLKDAKRIRNYDAFFKKGNKPDTVRLLELEDLV